MSPQPKPLRPFPWFCHQCGKTEVREVVCESFVARHEPQITISGLRIPTCQACGGMVYTDRVLDLIELLASM